MLNMIILIFVGGAFGAMCREFVMLSVPRLADGFPMDIFVANIVAAFLLGVATSLFKSNRINQYVHVMDDANPENGQHAIHRRQCHPQNQRRRAAQPAQHCSGGVHRPAAGQRAK